MKKSVAIILGTLMLICFSSVTTYQYSRIKYLENIIENKDSKFKTIQVKLSASENALASSLDDNKNLRAKIDILETKISKYKGIIKRLQHKIESQEEKIASLSNKLSEAQKKYIATISKLETLDAKPKNKLSNSDLKQKRQLLVEKDRLTQQIDKMYVSRNKIKDNKSELELKAAKVGHHTEKLEQTKLKFQKDEQHLAQIPTAVKIPNLKGDFEPNKTTNSVASIDQEFLEKEGTITPVNLPKSQPKPEENDLNLKKLNRILKDTWVKYYSIQLLKDKNGKPIRRLRKKKNNWNYTKIRFDIFSKSMKDIAGGQFQLQIIDSRTNKPIPSQENNPKFPDSTTGSNGVDFVSKNQKLRLELNNHQLKKGKNYHLLVSYKYNGKLYPIANSKLPIVKNRRVIF